METIPPLIFLTEAFAFSIYGRELPQPYVVF